MTFNEVIQKIQTELPKNYYIEVFIENDFGDIRVVDPDGNSLNPDVPEESTEEELTLILLHTAQEHSKTFGPKETRIITLDDF